LFTASVKLVGVGTDKIPAPLKVNVPEAMVSPALFIGVNPRAVVTSEEVNAVHADALAPVAFKNFPASPAEMEIK
jgi:hypothetical protein